MGKNNSKQTKKGDAFPSYPHFILEGSEFRGNVGGSAIANSYFCVPLLGKQEICESIKPRTTHPKESLIGHYNNVERRLSPADCNSPSGRSSSLLWAPPLPSPSLLTRTGSHQLPPVGSIFGSLHPSCCSTSSSAPVPRMRRGFLPLQSVQSPTN